MILYIDTNILLSQYDSSDTFNQINKKLLMQTDIIFVTGIITLLEFKSVIGRMWREKKVHVNEKMMNILKELSEFQQIEALIKYCFKTFNVKLIPTSGIAKLDFNNEIYEIDKNYFISLRLTPKIALRTLDILQIASAINIKFFSDYNVEFFITNDEKILKYSSDIRSLTQIIPISSEKLANLLKLEI